MIFSTDRMTKLGESWCFGTVLRPYLGTRPAVIFHVIGSAIQP